jgi:hypothetical protein
MSGIDPGGHPSLRSEEGSPKIRSARILVAFVLPSKVNKSPSVRGGRNALCQSLCLHFAEILGIAKEVMMTKSYFPVKITLGFTVKCLLSAGVSSVSLYSSQAQAHPHCPAGQILRVSKNACVPKQENMIFLTRKSKSAATSASVSIRNHVEDPVIPSPVVRPAVVEAPAVDAATTPPPPPPPQPEPIPPSPYGALSYQ